MKIIAYVRVSTTQQAEEGLGLEVQEQAIRSWARAHHHKIMAVIADEGISGAKELDDRPGLAEALAMVREGLVGGICVYRLDRLAWLTLCSRNNSLPKFAVREASCSQPRQPRRGT